MNDNVAGNNPGLITVSLQTGNNYRLADSGTSASVGVRDNAGTRGSEAYIVNPVATVEGSEMVLYGQFKSSTSIKH